mmetsp:Transcript_30131/g.49894  ORF Transcript_30131/g.49894 Transcript_30131/m.49894 type:complete len:206 (-) Transcript_30131:57-674(-)
MMLKEGEMRFAERGGNPKQRNRVFERSRLPLYAPHTETLRDKWISSSIEIPHAAPAALPRLPPRPVPVKPHDFDPSRYLKASPFSSSPHGFTSRYNEELYRLQQVRMERRGLQKPELTDGKPEPTKLGERIHAESRIASFPFKPPIPQTPTRSVVRLRPLYHIQSTGRLDRSLSPMATRSWSSHALSHSSTSAASCTTPMGSEEI